MQIRRLGCPAQDHTDGRYRAGTQVLLNAGRICVSPVLNCMGTLALHLRSQQRILKIAYQPEKPKRQAMAVVPLKRQNRTC